MKTSTLFACQTPQTELDLHTAMESLLEKNQNLRAIYGLQKVKSLELDQYVGVCGLVRTKGRIEGCNSQIVEIAIFMKPEFMNSNYGTSSILYFNKRVDELKTFLIASVWEKNVASIKLADKLGMIRLKKLQKTHYDRTINIFTYIKLPNFDIEELLSTKKVSKRFQL
jgi:RimJ/RimL family protein N-acetyltransferase